jgi:hypothetical protein
VDFRGGNHTEDDGNREPRGSTGQEKHHGVAQRAVDGRAQHGVLLKIV